MSMEYKRVKALLGNITDNVAEAKNLIKRPYYENQMGDNILIMQLYMLTMNDGMEIEKCVWAEADMLFVDISIDKKMFDESGNTDFLKYLESVGFYLENVQDAAGYRWEYHGLWEREEVYRITYYCVNATDDSED